MTRPAYNVSLSLILLAIVLTACGPATATPTATPLPATQVARPTSAPLSPLAEYYIPPYYAPEYINIVERSKVEGDLVIYSIMAEENWAPIIQIFNDHYPWIHVVTYDLAATEVFSRYNTDVEDGLPTADIVISSDQVGWQNFLAKKEVASYRSQEELFVPEWSKPTLGAAKASTDLYTVSSDPMVIIYNRKLVPAPLTSMAEIAALVQADPNAYRRKIVTYDAELNATGFSINWFWFNRTGEAGWDILTTLGKTSPVLMTSGSAMVDAVGKGEAALGYFVSAITVFPKLSTYPDLSWSYIMDGQPVMLRSMAITRKASNPNAAELMVDFILSQEGQLALEKGGLTPYRGDIASITKQHLNLISQGVGNEGLILFSLDDRIVDNVKRKVFLDRWMVAVQKPIPPTPTPTPTPTPQATPTP